MTKKREISYNQSTHSRFWLNVRGPIRIWRSALAPKFFFYSVCSQPISKFSEIYSPICLGKTLRLSRLVMSRNLLSPNLYLRDLLLYNFCNAIFDNLLGMKRMIAVCDFQDHFHVTRVDRDCPIGRDSNRASILIKCNECIQWRVVSVELE